MANDVDTKDAVNDAGDPHVQSPVGQGNYVVQPGDCMDSIAFGTGFLWKTLWELPDNAELKSQRDPHVLLPGDRVTIPPVRKREDPAVTEQRHKYVKHGTSTLFRLRFLDEELQPRSGLAYILTIDGEVTKGKLDGNGSLSVPIHPNAKQGSIQLQVEPDPENYQLNLGHLDPEASAAGVRARLNNLGFSCSADGDFDADLAAALKRFQASRELTVTGVLDDKTRQALKQNHKS